MFRRRETQAREVVANVDIRSIKRRLVSRRSDACTGRCESRAQRSLVNSRTQCREALGVAATRPSGTGSIRTWSEWPQDAWTERTRSPRVIPGIHTHVRIRSSSIDRAIRFSIAASPDGGPSPVIRGLTTMPNASWNNGFFVTKYARMFEANVSAEYVVGVMQNVSAAFRKIKKTEENIDVKLSQSRIFNTLDGYGERSKKEEALFKD